jgi:hypothetical protein
VADYRSEKLYIKSTAEFQVLTAILMKIKVLDVQGGARSSETSVNVH